VLLQADEVTYRHGGVDTDTLAPTSAAICAGSGLAVVGPNGSGKTTLARLLGGLVAPSGGDLRATGSLLDGVGEVRPDRWRPRELAGRIGSVFQNPEHSFLADTVRAELEVGPRALGEPEATVAATVEEVLTRLRLGHLQDANPFTLSGGEQRRLTVAAALTTAPRVLVLDEPTFGQDPSTWRELVGLMLGYLRDQGALAVMTHDVEFGERVCDRTLALEQRTPGVQ
jgi:energy-coupling factor transport system ATP-binding protein